MSPAYAKLVQKLHFIYISNYFVIQLMEYNPAWDCGIIIENMKDIFYGNWT